MTKARIRAIREASKANSAHKAIIAELLKELEYWQKRARAGQELTDQPEKPKGNDFIARWHDDYDAFHGRPYILTGKDAGQVKALLAQITNIDGLMSVAKKAWARTDLFHCKRAVSLYGFCTGFNEIVAELKGINGTAQRPPTVRL